MHPYDFIGASAPVSYLTPKHGQPIPQFTVAQIKEWGMPETYGYPHYEVIDTNACVDYVTDYTQSQSLTPRKIHRYDRVERFESILCRLLGMRGSVPQNIMDLVVYEIKLDPMTVWEDVRSILKTHGHVKYYNLIPTIIRNLGFYSSIDCDSETYCSIMETFKKFSHYFDTHHRDWCLRWNRKYFPNLRFIAIQLLNRYNVVFNYWVPDLRTCRKRKVLVKIIEEFIN